MSSKTDLVSRMVLSTGFLWKTPLGPYLKDFREEGFTRLELVFVDRPWEEGEAQHVAKIAKEEGVDFYSIHAPFVGVDLTTSDDDLWEHSKNQMVRTFAIAEILQVQTVVLHPGGIYSDSQEAYRYHRVRKALEALIPEAEAHDVRIAVENMMPKFWGRRLGDLVALVQDLPNNVGICMDTSHLVMSEIPVDTFWESLGNRVIHTHLSDNWGEGLDDHLLPDAEGKVPWDRVMAYLLPEPLPLTFEIYHTYGDMPFRDFLNLARQKLFAFLKKYEKKGGLV